MGMAEQAGARLPERSADEWRELVERLTLHADNRLRCRTWRGDRLADGDGVPGGFRAEDFAQEAVLDVLQGRRAYDPVTRPDFLAFLCDVVDSKISHLSMSKENRVTRRVSSANDDDSELQVSDGRTEPATTLCNEEDLARLRGEVRAELDLDPIASRIVTCCEDGMKRPAEIADVLGIDVKDVYNGNKRLTRIFEQARQRLAARSRA